MSFRCATHWFYLFTLGCVPKSDGLIDTRGENLTAVGEFTSRNCIDMTLKLSLNSHPCSELYYIDSEVVASCGNQSWWAVEAHTAHRFGSVKFYLLWLWAPISIPNLYHCISATCAYLPTLIRKSDYTTALLMGYSFGHHTWWDFIHNFIACN